jgi:anti-sigma regulatory factor (Ser/Thr protein kinase)
MNEPGQARRGAGATLSAGHPAQLLPRTDGGPVTGHPQSLPPWSSDGPERPRIVPLPAAWWDAPPAAGCSLSRGPRSAAAARRLTRETLRKWGLSSLADDAELIVGELVANAVTHGARPGGGREPGGENLRLRLRLRLRRGFGEVICAVIDPSDTVPVVKAPGCSEHSGRGLQIVDALSEVWGWSPIPGRGKAVWAVLSVAHRRAGAQRSVPPQKAR